MDGAHRQLTANDNFSSAIQLAHMPQQAHVWSAEDDWTGVIDRKERRKLQNRQNQRKWRERRKATRPSQESRRASASTTTSTSATTSDTGSGNGEIQQLRCAHAPPNALEYMRWFEATARKSYLLGSPKSEHLIRLTRLNVHRAIVENVRAIGMDVLGIDCDDSLSIFNHPPSPSASEPGSGKGSGLGYRIETIPVALRPTEIQKMIPHHPWLDFFPFPRMRDCLITASHLFDDDELCHDLMAFWDTRNTEATLLVWGQPWDPRNWEATEGFVRKWNWLLKGSTELLVSTNYWRRRRGEQGIVWKDVLPP
ncbi:bZIP transcription factor [Aspergillus lucknowensis]|uniref:BZIP domain-containing protein n=1 Tax=Aspergillus lucknowensis TaxID=176173 RepID=A0ABR4LMY8_9EURO